MHGGARTLRAPDTGGETAHAEMLSDKKVETESQTRVRTEHPPGTPQNAARASCHYNMSVFSLSQ